MGGFGYGDEMPTQNCPYCGTECVAEYVDVGVGYVQCAPHVCENCHAVEIGPYDEPRDLTDREEETGWYEPTKKV